MVGAEWILNMGYCYISLSCQYCTKRVIINTYCPFSGQCVFINGESGKIKMGEKKFI